MINKGIRHSVSLLLTIYLFFFSCSFLFSQGNQEHLSPEGELPEFSQIQGPEYFISYSGDDSNDGLSPESPWKSIEKVNEFIASRDYILPGSSFLFERGGTYRGFLKPGAGTAGNWMRIGAYGSGETPLLSGAVLLNSTDDWVALGHSLWRTSREFSRDIGGLFWEEGNTGAGERKWELSSLSKEGDFLFDPAVSVSSSTDPYFDPTGGDRHLYLYSSKNPALNWSQMEASRKEVLITLNERRYLQIENLHLEKGAAHGIGGTDSHHIIIRNCDFSYLGGGYLHYNSEHSREVRFGNGIEFWGDAHSCLVDSNRFWEIFDTAVTNQGHSDKSIQRHLYYMNNLIWNCGLASFELWNRPSSSEMSFIYFLHNTSVNPGFGWGGASFRPDKTSFHVASFYNEAQGESLVIENNIFYSSSTPDDTDYHLFFLDEDVKGGYGKYRIDYNLWEMPEPAWAVTTSIEYTSFSEWQAVNGQSQHGITGDPLFADPAQGDFSLSFESPAIDAGHNTLRLRDFSGTITEGSAPDLGALEYYSFR